MEGLPSQVGDVRTPLAAATPSPIRNVEQSDISYAISVTGTQLIFNGTTFNQIRGTFFQRDSAYFAFRNVLDQLISTVKTQFYQIIVNRDLVSVNEENVHLLEAQLKDQQNRFEAGTVPRFNVLQADVQLHNQIPQLITAQNNLRISKLQLAKTLGLDFQRRFGDRPPLEVIGDMPYIPRSYRTRRRDRNGEAAASVSETSAGKRIEPAPTSARGSRPMASQYYHDRWRRMGQLTDQLKLA